MTGESLESILDKYFEKARLIDGKYYVLGRENRVLLETSSLYLIDYLDFRYSKRIIARYPLKGFPFLYEIKDKAIRIKEDELTLLYQFSEKIRSNLRFDREDPNLIVALNTKRRGQTRVYVDVWITHYRVKEEKVILERKFSGETINLGVSRKESKKILSRVVPLFVIEDSRSKLYFLLFFHKKYITLNLLKESNDFSVYLIETKNDKIMHISEIDKAIPAEYIPQINIYLLKGRYGVVSSMYLVKEDLLITNIIKPAGIPNYINAFSAIDSISREIENEEDLLDYIYFPKAININR